MDLVFVIHHLICGFIPMVAALLLYFVILHQIGKKQTAGHIFVSFIFCIYLIGVLTVTGICLRGSFSPTIVYIPFVDMIRGPLDTLLNILMLVPMGFFLPLLYEKYDKVTKVALVGFLISLSIEIFQLFGGKTDINDLMTNTLGACLGFGIYLLAAKIIPKSWIKSVRVEGNQCYYELIIFWIGMVLLMLSIQVSIFHFLYPSGMDGGEIQVWH